MRDFNNLTTLIPSEYDNIRGVVIRHENKLIYEHYFNGYEAKDEVHVASVTKSILSGLIGVAFREGKIASVDQKVLAFFPDYRVKRGEKWIQTVTIKNLLTMTALFKFQSEPYAKVYGTLDWTKASLNFMGGEAPGHDFRYQSVGAQILAGILKQATGQKINAYAHDKLFEPLGIGYKADYEVASRQAYMKLIKEKMAGSWAVDPSGTHTGGYGLTLSPREMALFGQLYLDKGVWHGKEILPSWWIKDSTSWQAGDNDRPYGYLWWLVGDENIPAYAAMGDGGNIIYVCPSKKLVVAIGATFKPRAVHGMDLIEKYLLPDF